MNSKLTLINLIIATLIFTVIYSMVSVDVGVHVLTRAGSLELNNGTVYFSVPVEVHNGGLYEMNDVFVHVQAAHGDVVLFSDNRSISKLPALKSASFVFHGNISLIRSYQLLGDDFVFNGSTVQVLIEISGNYEDMATFKINYTKHIKFPPLLYSFIIFPEKAKFGKEGMEISYFVNTIENLNKVNLHVEVYDNFGTIAVGNETAVIGREAFIHLHLERNVNFMLFRNDVLNFHAQLNIMGVIISRDLVYTWHAPLDFPKEILYFNGTPYLRISVKSNMDNQTVALKIRNILSNDTLSFTKVLKIKEGLTVNIPLMNSNTTIVATISDKNVGLSYTLVWAGVSE